MSPVDRRSASAIPTLVGWSVLALSGLALLYPALINGFPIVFYDTGGYIERAFLFDLTPGRSIIYGLAVTVSGLYRSLWPVILLQTAIVIWIVRLTMRVLGVPTGPGAMAGIILGLSALTGVGWFSSQVMPDILAAFLILILFLLGFHRSRLTGPEKAALFVIGQIAMLSHMAHLALGLVLATLLCLAMAAARITYGRLEPRLIDARLPVVLVLTALLLAPTLNGLLAGRFQFTPGGQTFLFGRLIQDGIVARFLDDRCPSPDYRLCTYRDTLPETANDWIWADWSPFKAIGGWESGAEEMQRITHESLAAYPLQHFVGAARSTVTQFLKFKTGDGLTARHWHTKYQIDRLMPNLSVSFGAARQQRGELDFHGLNRIHEPVGYLSLAATALLFVGFVRRGRFTFAALTAFVLIALLANAFICGALSNPHDRYQARLIWLPTLCVLLTIVSALGRNAAVTRGGDDEATLPLSFPVTTAGRAPPAPHRRR